MCKIKIFQRYMATSLTGFFFQNFIVLANSPIQLLENERTVFFYSYPLRNNNLFNVTTWNIWWITHLNVHRNKNKAFLKNLRVCFGDCILDYVHAKFQYDAFIHIACGHVPFLPQQHHFLCNVCCIRGFPLYMVFL